MRVGSRRYAYLSAAVIAALYGASPYGASSAHARNLTWDPTGTSAASGGSDGSGTWDTSSTDWVDSSTTPPTNVTWSNANPDSAIFGTAPAGTAPTGKVFPDTVSLGTTITVQDITLGTASNGTFYNIADQGDGGQTLTLAGNVTKTAVIGGSIIQLTNPLVLTAGAHVFGVQDTPNDFGPELTVSNGLTGSGSVTIDNGTFPQWGSIAFLSDSNYTGGTNINKGRLEIATAGALGTGTTTIANQGVLSIGGSTSVIPAGNLTIATPITITRNTYTGTDFNDYPDAIISDNPTNAGKTVTFSGPFVIDSTDARVAARTSTINIASPLTAGPTVGAGNAVFTADGDFAGFITLSADNTAFGAAGNTIKIIGGVEVNVSSEANLGGATSKLNLAGGYLHPTGSLASGAFMTNFGSHVINNGTDATHLGTLSTGVDLDAGNTFNASGLFGVALGERGKGTLNFNGTNVFSGAPFFDGGVINVNGNTTVGQFFLRNPTLNVNNGATLTATGGFNDIGFDGTDKGTVNVLGGGTLALNHDFNVADNPNSQGTLNINPNATVNAGGGLFIAKQHDTAATVNMTGGTLTVGGETWVGNSNNFGGPGGVGVFNQSGGSTTVNNWFAIGRFGAQGTFNLSGGTFTKQGGGNAYVGEATPGITSTATLSGSSVYNSATGEFWVGNSGGTGILNIQDSASFSVNNWFAIGRFGGVGTLNFSGGTITKTGGGNFDIAGGGENSTRGTLNQTGGAIVSNSTWIAETNGIGVANLSGGTASLGNLDVGHNQNGTGTLNISGTAAVTAGPVVIGAFNSSHGTLNLNGGSLTAGSIAGGASSSPKTFNFNGGTLLPSGDSTTFMGGLTNANVQAGGALINTNGHAITIGQALVHDAGLGATADGGLTVSGTGTLTLTAANTYTGGTRVNGGTLVAGNGDAFADGALAVADGGTAQVQAGINKAATITTLSIGGTSGKLDVNDRVVVKNSTLSYVEGQLAAGRNVAPGGIGDGTWNGSHGIVSSRAAAQIATDGIESRVVGVGVSGQMPFGDPVDPATNQPVFAGANAGDILLRYTKNADATLDGVVDDQDVTVVGAFYDAGKTSGHHWYEGDFNGDGKIDDSDVTILGAFYQPGVTASFLQSLNSDYGSEFAKAFEAGLSLQAQVPEPSTITLVGLATAGLLARRRRRA